MINSQNIKANLIETRSFINYNQNNLYPYNRDNIIEMLDYAISNWDNPNIRLDAVSALAEKEIELNKSGIIEDDDRDNDEGFFVAILDELLDSNEDEEILEGLGRINFKKKKEDLKKKWKKRRDDRKDKRQDRKDDRKDKRQDRKDDRKNNTGQNLHKINKFNPVTVGVRNALRTLLLMNAFGYATILNSRQARAFDNKKTDSSVCDKVTKMYYSLGGDKNKLYDAIKKGAKKRPLLNPKIKKQLDSGNFKGLQGELGEVASISLLLGSAGAYIIKIYKWIKSAGLDKLVLTSKGKTGDPSSNDQGGASNSSNDQGGASNSYNDPGGAINTPPPTSYTPMSPISSPTSQQNGGGNGILPDTSADRKKKTLIVVGLGATILLAGTGYYFATKNKEELKGIEFSA